MRNVNFRRRGVLSRAELGSGESALEARAPSHSVFYSVPEEAGLTQGKPQGLFAFPWGHSLVLWNLWGNGLLPLLRLTHPRSHQACGWDELKTHCLPLWGRHSGGSYPEAHQTPCSSLVNFTDSEPTGMWPLQWKTDWNKMQPLTHK